MSDDFIVPDDLKVKYLERRAEDVLALRHAMAAGNFEFFERVAFNLQGTYTTYGFSSLDLVIAGLRKTAKEPTAALARSQIYNLEQWILSNKIT